MIFYIEGKRAAMANNVISVAKNIHSSTINVEGQVYRILKKYPSEFNKGVFNYLVEKETSAGADTT